MEHINILESSCIIFVYNSISNYSANDLHISECVYEDEIALIKDSFHAFPNLKLLTYESEELFLNAANLIKQTLQIYFALINSAKSCNALIHCAAVFSSITA